MANHDLLPYGRGSFSSTFLHPVAYSHIVNDFSLNGKSKLTIALKLESYDLYFLCQPGFQLCSPPKFVLLRISSHGLLLKDNGKVWLAVKLETSDYPDAGKGRGGEGIHQLKDFSDFFTAATSHDLLCCLTQALPNHT